MGQLLNSIDWVYTEVNVKHLYKNCALLYQVDAFLLKKDFIRVQTYMTTHFWGDALYRKKRMNQVEKWLRLLVIYLGGLGRSIRLLTQPVFTKTATLAWRTLRKLKLAK
jgi:hypothetical protein